MSKHEDLIEVLRCIGSAICSEAADALEAQAREIEGLRLKAERYDWLREAGAWESEIGMDSLTPEEFDARVDYNVAYAKGAPHG